MTGSVHSLGTLLGYALASMAMAYSVICALLVNWKVPSTQRQLDRLPPVTVLKPLCGAEPETYGYLRSFCTQDYPTYQIVFGVCDPRDPALQIVERLQAEFPQLDITVVVEHRQHGSNRKISNLINMMPVARHEYLILSDSDVRVEAQYLARLVAPLMDEHVGIVTCCYRGVPRSGVWSLLGAMFINGWFMPSVRIAAVMGYRSFAFGATIAMRAEVLARIGGFAAIANQLPDDYRLGELTRGLGLRTVLSEVEVETLVFERSAAELIAHELRWRRTIRNLSPYGYSFSFITLGFPVTAASLLMLHGALPALAIFTTTSLASLWVHLNPRCAGSRLWKLWLAPVRDLAHLGLWIWSFATHRVQWGSRHYQLSRDGTALPEARF